MGELRHCGEPLLSQQPGAPAVVRIGGLKHLEALDLRAQRREIFARARAHEEPARIVAVLDHAVEALGGEQPHASGRIGEAKRRALRGLLAGQEGIEVGERRRIVHPRV